MSEPIHKGLKSCVVDHPLHVFEISQDRRQRSCDICAHPLRARCHEWTDVALAKRFNRALGRP
jgi:hypothetical protein